MYTGQFRFGRECRVCSDWECPIGQYRITCTPNSDSYCKPCTNKPSDQAYLTPGNDNDCQYGKKPRHLQHGDFNDNSDPAVVATTLEVPMTAESFNAKGSDIKAAVAEASGVSVDKVVFSGGATEFPMSKVNDNMCKKPEGVDSWTEPTFCYTSGSSSTAKDTTSTSGRCADLCGSGDPPEFCANSDSRFADTCTWSIQNECCPRGRRTASTSRRLLNATTSDSCAFDLDLGTKNGQQYFVTIDVEITTTVGRIDKTWDKINEHDLNQAFAKKCLPPVVVTYEPVDTAEAPHVQDITIPVAVFGGLILISCCWCWYAGWCDTPTNKKEEPEVSPEPEQPNQEPGAETGQTSALSDACQPEKGQTKEKSRGFHTSPPPTCFSSSTRVHHRLASRWAKDPKSSEDDDLPLATTPATASRGSAFGSDRSEKDRKDQAMQGRLELVYEV